MRQSVTVSKAINTPVFEKAPDNAFDLDILGHAGDARAKATDAAHHELDLDACAGSLVEGLDHLGIDE